jgi:riboflavin-specific deaminase-like protein
VLADDPRLTVRLVAGRDPQPVIVDSRLRFPLDARLLTNGQRRPWIVAGPAADPAREAALTAAGARVLRLPTTAAGQIDLAALLTCLHGHGIATLMVEGGARVITSFLAGRLVDQMVVTVAPLLLGGQRAVGLLEPPAGPCAGHLTNVRYHQLGADLIIRGDLAWSNS